MFRSAVRYLRFKPEDGLHVDRARPARRLRAEGRVPARLRAPRSRSGLGALQLAFEQLKKKLQAEGLFDAARKRPLPALPRKIGIVTSLDGAALRDIIKVLRRRHPNAHLVIRPARVQGEGAAAEIAAALRAIARVAGVDVVIVGARRRIDRGPLGVQRGASRAPSPPRPVPVDRRRSATRSTSRSPTSSPICARRRRRRPRRWWSRRRTSSAAGSIGCRTGSRPRRAAGAQRRRARRARARPAAAGWPAGRRGVAMRGRHAAELTLPDCGAR